MCSSTLSKKDHQNLFHYLAYTAAYSAAHNSYSAAYSTNVTAQRSNDAADIAGSAACGPSSTENTVSRVDNTANSADNTANSADNTANGADRAACNRHPRHRSSDAGASWSGSSWGRWSTNSSTNVYKCSGRDLHLGHELQG